MGEGSKNSRKRANAVLLGALLFAALVPNALEPNARAQVPDTLVPDSLVALDALVAPAKCRLIDAADGSTGAGERELPYRFCDDGLPQPGGGAGAIPVPVKYQDALDGSGDWEGLPAPASLEEALVAAAEDDLQPEAGNRISLDVDVAIPTRKPADGGRPVIVLMHGCCGGNKTSWEATSIDADGERWHHSNAYWAARGYVVVTYTARGFRDANDRGSTGTTQLNSRSYEINDFQYLVGLIADHDRFLENTGEEPIFDINPGKVGVVGGSYGGGFAWLALTDPKWRSPSFAIPMRLAAAVPKYGWTDLLESLLPGGHYEDRDPRTGEPVVAPSKPATAISRKPLGVQKQSIVAGLYASGNLMTGNHTTFPQWLHDAFARLGAGEPYNGDPILEEVADSFIRDRSAYFQTNFWSGVRAGLKVPIFAVATWTDPLFPTMESVRFYNKLKSLRSEYPIQMYLGDYQHFVQNKDKEWGDLCGTAHRVCTVDDFRGEDGKINLSRAPKRVRRGINGRINQFLDHYLLGKAKPTLNVAATTTVCPANESGKYPVDEPGIEYRAKSWRGLTPARLLFNFNSGGNVNSNQVDSRGTESDPVLRSQQADKCYTTTDTAAPPGVVQYTSPKIDIPFTMMGLPAVVLDYSTKASTYWVEGRLFDLAPNGVMTMVSRSSCRVDLPSSPQRGCAAFELSGNGWRFERNHRLVLELSSADTPYLRKSNEPSNLNVSSAILKIPIVPEAQLRDFRK